MHTINPSDITPEKLGTMVDALRSALAEIQTGQAANGLDTSKTDAGLGQLDELKVKLAGAVDAQFITAIEFMTNRVHTWAIDKGFWPAGFVANPTLNNGRNDGEAIALMHSELSELLEAARDGYATPSTKIPGFSNAEEEAADLFIRLIDLAGGRRWRLGEAILAKHAYNMNRPHKHGRQL